MAYTTVPAAQDGSALSPYLSNSNPATSPGFAAEVHAILKDQITGTLYIKTGTSDTAWEPISGSSAYKTDEEYYKYRAQTLMKSPRLTCWWWSDLLEPQGEEFTFASSAGSPTFAVKNNDCGVGAIVAPAGATGFLYMGNETSTVGNSIPGGATSVWYIAARYRAYGTGDCFNELGGRLSGVNDFCLFGDYTVSTTNFWGITTKNHGNANSSVANDNATHVHELYRDGTTTYYLIDESVIMTGAYYPDSNCSLAIRCGAVSGSNTMAIDWVSLAVGGNNPRTIS